MPFLEVRNISQQFESVTALTGVSLTFEEREFVVLAGRSGSGKTVLIRHLNGLLAPTSGEILLEGRSMAKVHSRARTIIGMVFQEPEHQIVGQTVEEDVAFGPRNLRLEQPEVTARVDRALELFELQGKRHSDPRTLSGGERRRLALAGVFAMKPRLVICDEPFSNLDYPGVVDVLGALTALNESGCGIIVVTHEVEKVLAHATRLIVLSEGRVAYDGEASGAIPRFAEWGLRPPVTQEVRSGETRADADLVATLTWLTTTNPPDGTGR